MRIFLKKCPECGKDHRSFKRAMSCYLPYKHMVEYLKHNGLPISPEVHHQFETFKKYLHSRFGCN